MIQEITDRPGWVEGNALVLIVTGDGERVADSYDGDPAGSPALHVDFIPPSAGNAAPVVSITAPADGSSFTAGETVSFAGSAADAEDGDVTAGLSWVSSLDGAIGGGGGFSTTALSVGTHVVTATATDGLGLPGEAQVSLTVTKAPEPVLVASPSGSTGYDANGGRNDDKHLIVTVTLVDGNGAPVPGTLVSATVSGPASESGSGTTDALGQMTVAVRNAPPGIYSTTVTSVSADGYLWDGTTPDNSFDKTGS